jgi:putative transposase
MKELQIYISNDKHFSIRRQCGLLGISRSNLYYKEVGESKENLLIMRQMDEEFMDHPTHGVIQIPKAHQAFASQDGYHGDLPRAELKQVRSCKVYQVLFVAWIKNR